MYEQDPYSTARDCLTTFYSNVQMPGGYFFDHALTLRKADAFYNSQFTTGNKDSVGMRKYFYNIVKAPCDIATKFVDLDTKDITLVSETPDDEWVIWLMQRDLRCWLKEKGIGKLLNQIAFDYPKYGSVVTKKGKDNKWAKVNLQNMRLDPGADTLEDSYFVIEVHDMSARELAGMPWDEEAKARLLDSPAPRFIIYEAYFQNRDSSKKKWCRRFLANFLTCNFSGRRIETAESQIIKTGAEYLPGITLFEDEVDELPYRELHWEKVPGRWLGLGFVEHLFDNQVRMNELTNVKAKGLYFTSLKLFQTRDPGVMRNVLSDAQNGDVLSVNSEITPLQNEERNLAVFNQEEQRWDKNTNEKTFSFDIARGDDLPSNTPLGVAQMSQAMVVSYFQIKQENFGLFVKDVILDDVIPQFQRENSKKHTMRFASSDKDIEKLRQAMVDIYMRDSILGHVFKTGSVPEPIEVAQFKESATEQLKRKGDLFVDITDNYYEAVKYNLDIIITGEQTDVRAKLQTMMTALQMISANPAILQDGPAKTMLFSMLEMVGCSPVDMGLTNYQAPPPPTPEQGQAAGAQAMPNTGPVQGAVAQAV